MTDGRFGPRSPAGGKDDDQTGRRAILSRLTERLPPEMRGEFDTVCERRRVAPGEVLVEDGEEPSHIGYVIGGMLGMVKRLPDGRRHIIGLLLPSDIYGRLYDGRSGYRIEALTEADLLTCDRAAFEDLLRRAPALERMLLVEILDELDAAREWVLVLGGPKVVQRAASFLLILCRRKLRDVLPEALEASAPVNLKLTLRRSDLAQFLGARPESLSRAFHELEHEGILRINDPADFDVIDLAGLVVAAGNDLVLDRRDATGGS
jgi:CRP/FNR family transcriptional regulator